MNTPPISSLRIDKWLWAVRLYKTRATAAEVCSAGKVKRLNTSNNSLKPSSSVKIGDRLLVPSHDGIYKREIEITTILEKRSSAPIAQAAYIDHTKEEVLLQAKSIRSENNLNKQHRKEGDQGRMTKKQRRDWRKGLGSNKDSD